MPADKRKPPGRTVTPPLESAIGQRRLKRRLESTRGDGNAKKSDKRWGEILAGAARVFHDVGFAASTLERIAAEVGIDRASLYYYVANKEELLIAILNGPIHKMTADIVKIQRLEVSPPEKLRRAVLRHMKALEDNYPELFVFVAQSLHTMDAAETRGIRTSTKKYGRIMKEIIQEGIDSGDFRADLDPTIVMRGIIGMCNWSHRWYHEKGRYSLSEIGAQFADLLLEGLLA